MSLNVWAMSAVKDLWSALNWSRTRHELLQFFSVKTVRFARSFVLHEINAF